MLEKPELPDEWLISQTQAAFGQNIIEITFLPIGADASTAVYRASSQDGVSYFLKLRKGAFDETSSLLPLYLQRSGVRPVIAPILAVDGQAWASLGEYTLLLYPFIDGQDGYQSALSDRQWVEFGVAMQAVHALQPPPDLQNRIPRETCSPRWRDQLTRYQRQIEQGSPLHVVARGDEEQPSPEKSSNSDVVARPLSLGPKQPDNSASFYLDHISADLVAFMQSHRDEITYVVRRAEQLAGQMQSQSLPFVLCHTDLHPGNLLISGADVFYIVDWDAPLFAPRERDLMFIGGMSGNWQEPRLGKLFYQGYGETAVNRTALAYYRYERIVEDMAVECELIFSSNRGNEDREQELGYFKSNFLPGNVIELAKGTDR